MPSRTLEELKILKEHSLDPKEYDKIKLEKLIRHIPPDSFRVEYVSHDQNHNQNHKSYNLKSYKYVVIGSLGDRKKYKINQFGYYDVILAFPNDQDNPDHFHGFYNSTTRHK